MATIKICSTILPMFITNRRISTAEQNMPKKAWHLKPVAAEAKAKFYFQLAMAQAGKGQTADACASFKNAMYGAFAEPSKVQRTNLKCQ